MKAIEFPEVTCVFAKDQPEYLPLPVHLDKENCGMVTSCYELTLKERLKILFGANVWLQIMTFNKPLQPQLITVEKPPALSLQ
jgi:hypothetical protein